MLPVLHVHVTPRGIFREKHIHGCYIILLMRHCTAQQGASGTVSPHKDYCELILCGTSSQENLS